MVHAFHAYANAARNTLHEQEQQSPVPASDDEKNDMVSLQTKLQRRRKPLYAGLVFLAVVLIGVTVSVSRSPSSSAKTESAQVRHESRVLCCQEELVP